MVQCTLYTGVNTVQYTVYSVQCTVYNGTVYTVHWC